MLRWWQMDACVCGNLSLRAKRWLSGLEAWRFLRVSRDANPIYPIAIHDSLVTANFLDDFNTVYVLFPLIKFPCFVLDGGEMV